MSDQIAQLEKLRRDLHAYPERSGEEKTTAARITEFLKSYPPHEILTHLGGNGLAAIYNMAIPGPTVMLRCELDALPIDEINSFDHKSRNQGFSHKCGHDGHMSILSGVAQWLHKLPLKKGKVVLLFQPAEENGAGAQAVLNDPEFENINPDFVFALHNLPGHDMHKIMVYHGQFSPTVQSLAIKLIGKKSHASEPENGINPALAISSLIHELDQLKVTDSNSPDFTLITPVHIKMGQPDYGISAGEGEVHITLRCWTVQNVEALKNKINQLLLKECKSSGLKHETKWFDYFPTVKNDSLCNEIILKSANMSGFNIEENYVGCKFGEDFGWFTQKYKGAMFGLGAGLSTPALHHVEYDFPDELIPTGVQVFKNILTEILS